MARILIVDDEPILRRTLFQSLSMLGHEVISAVNGHEGALRACDSDPHLVITDVNMPGNEEGRFILDLRLTRPGLPVIVMSGSIQDDFTSYTRSGCLALAKPFSISELNSLVGLALKSEARRASAALV